MKGYSKIYLLFALVLAIQSSSHTPALTLRTQTKQHNLYDIISININIPKIPDVSIQGQWTGDQCNSACQQAKGIVCGFHWIQCCAQSCEGIFVKTCKDGEHIKIDCPPKPVKPVKKPVSDSTYPTYPGSINPSVPVSFDYQYPANNGPNYSGPVSSPASSSNVTTNFKHA